MLTMSRFALSILAVASVVSLAGVAEAGPRRGGRQNGINAPAPVDKAQLLVNRANAMINYQAARFPGELDDFAEDLAELLEEVNNNTSEDDVFDFAFDFEDDLFDEEWKANMKIDRVADRAIARLVFMGADPTYALSIDNARAAAQATIAASVMDMLTQLDLAIEEALAIAALPDDVDDDEDDDDDDDDDDCDSDDDSDDDDDDDDD